MPGLPSIGPFELILVLGIALLILGPGKLPDLGSALGKTIREFRKAATDMEDAASLDTKPKEATSAPKATVVTAPAEEAEIVTARAATPVTPADPERAR